MLIIQTQYPCVGLCGTKNRSRLLQRAHSYSSVLTLVLRSPTNCNRYKRSFMKIPGAENKEYKINIRLWREINSKPLRIWQ
jgi:hypothetical protein